MSTWNSVQKNYIDGTTVINAEYMNTLQSKVSETVSVKDFGAVGDGVADDTAAIQTAVDNCVGKTLTFPSGTYIIGATIYLPSGIRLLGEQGRSTLKLKSQSWGTSNGLMFEMSVDTDVQFDSLVFDGNKGNVGTTRSPIVVVFDSQRIAFEDCIFQNCEGICLNISTDTDDIEVVRCKFLNCGGNPDGSDGYQKQAIAFSTNDVDRSKNIRIEGCYFYRQGLDCISLTDCDNVVVSNNTAIDGYTLVYNNPFPMKSTNLVIDGNVVSNCSIYGSGLVPWPLAVDLPSVDGVIVTGNSFYAIDSSAIGLFGNTKNATVSGNTIVNAMRGADTTKVSAIIAGGETSDIALDSIVIEGNLIVDTATTALMKYGIVVKSNSTNVLIQDNVIRNPLIARYGKTSTNNAESSIAAFTSSTEVSSSCRVADLDIANNLETAHGRVYIQATDNTNPAVRITQLGSANALEVYDAASDTTPFAVDTDGDVGVRISPAVFGGPLSTSGSGTANNIVFQSFGNDNNQVRIQGAKTRAVNAYTHGLLAVNDLILKIEARGSDGVNYQEAAYIQLGVEGTPALNSMPGRIALGTAPTGSVTPVNRLLIKQSGAVRFIPQATPASAEAGDVYYDSGTNKLRCFNGSIWNDLF